MAPQPPKSEGTIVDELPASVIRAENEAARTGTDDDVVTERGRPGQHVDQGAQQENNDGLTRREMIQRSPQDDARAAIANRFKRNESADERQFNNDFSDQENLYGEAGRRPEPEAQLSDEEYDRRAAEAEQAGEEPPARKPKPTTLKENVGAEDDQRMITRKVRGKDVTKSEEEWLADAAKVTAADSYLEEAKALLAEAKEIRRVRTAPDRQHPDDDRTQDELEPPAGDEDHHPDPTFTDVVRQIQFGDPEEAAQLLEQVVTTRSKKATSEGERQRLYDQDLAHSKRQLKAFADANPDLAADRISAIAIEQGMYDLYKEDIIALGIEESQLPQTPAELANWHRFYRMSGYDVRPTKDLLEHSKQKFLKWKGVADPSTQTRQQSSRKELPRVRVNVDRDDRRMAIPVQPQRGVAPRRDAPPPQAAGSSVVAQMRKARGQV